MNININKESVNFFKKNGYIIFNIHNDNLIDEVNNDIEKHVKSGLYKTN